MIHAFKVARLQSQYPFLAPASSIPSSSSIYRISTGSVRFQQAKTESNNQPKDSNMDQQKAQNPNEKTGDVMSHSFGEGYATRSDEEGFGGIYGGNQSFPQKSEEDQGKVIHENHPEYDKTQGSEVNEKEKGRNQAHIA